MSDKVKLKKYEIFQPLLLAFMVIVGMILGQKLEQSSTPEQKNKAAQISSSRIQPGLIDEAVRYINARYIDSVGTDRLSDLAIQSLIRNLDPFSVYLPAGTFADLPNQSFGQSYGFLAKKIKSQWLVQKINPGSPAQQSGLRVGDMITRIGGQPPSNQTFEGWTADSLDLILVKPESGQESQVNVKKQLQSVFRTVDPALILNSNTGYLRIRHFGDHTYDEFITALDTLTTKHHLQHFILDIRNNSGGYLEECSRILNQLFRDKNLLLVTTKGRTVRKTEYKTDGRQLFNINQIIVLIDGGSASASEVFAGAIQDLKRGKVIGQPSYGKGLVQEQYMLSNGSALRLSVARYYLPSGRTIDFNGDYEPSFEELRAAQGIKMIVHKTIIPDIAVQADTSLNSNEWQAILDKINEVVLLQKVDERKGRVSKNVIQDIQKKFVASLAPAQLKFIGGEKERVRSLLIQSWAMANQDYKTAEKERLLKEKEIQAALRQINP
ncbi:MAG: S41 family peptidase [Saprospiraceae bacterium]|nr:S41 family peptidase [Saprospiraceae bacterium]